MEKFSIETRKFQENFLSFQISAFLFINHLSANEKKMWVAIRLPKGKLCIVIHCRGGHGDGGENAANWDFNACFCSHQWCHSLQCDHINKTDFFSRKFFSIKKRQSMHEASPHWCYYRVIVDAYGLRKPDKWTFLFSTDD